MAGPRIKLNSREIEKFLKSDQVRPSLRDIAEGWASTARRTAPVDTGEYRDSIDVVEDTTDRAVARVITRAPHGLIVESRTGNLKRAMGG